MSLGEPSFASQVAGSLAILGATGLAALRVEFAHRRRLADAARQIVEEPANASWATTIGLRPSDASTAPTGASPALLDEFFADAARVGPIEYLPARPYDWSIDDQEGSPPCPPRSF